MHRLSIKSAEFCRRCYKNIFILLFSCTRCIFHYQQSADLGVQLKLYTLLLYDANQQYTISIILYLSAAAAAAAAAAADGDDEVAVPLQWKMTESHPVDVAVSPVISV